MAKSLENQDTRASKQKKAVLSALARNNAAFLAVAANVAADMELNLSEMVVTDHLHLHGATTPGILATKTRLSSGAMTTLLDRLEQRGFVRRIPHPSDRRSILVEYIPQSSQKLSRIHAILEGYQNILESFSAKEHATLQKFLKQVADVHEQVVS